MQWIKFWKLKFFCGHEALRLYIKWSKKFNFLLYYGTKISIFYRGIKICGPNFSYLIFEAVNFWGFWGPAEMRGHDLEENKVVPLIFKQFWSRSHLNNLDWLTPQDVYCCSWFWHDAPGCMNCVLVDSFHLYLEIKVLHTVDHFIVFIWFSRTFKRCLNFFRCKIYESWFSKAELWIMKVSSL